ncbi:hypothetical protein CS542_05005 [Pedobacter sp. IW39]|nr:hypothetical protein CS542_05005 [Pedobacter sp. IW39]
MNCRTDIIVRSFDNPLLPFLFRPFDQHHTWPCIYFSPVYIQIKSRSGLGMFIGFIILFQIHINLLINKPL